MVHIDVVYESDLHCTSTHGPSGATLSTDAPVDNHGRGESFSPTDLVATALGCCMATVMGIQARAQGWPVEGTRLHVTKEMVKTGPRRISRLGVKAVMPDVTRSLSAEVRAALEHTANTCPVRLSILDAIEVPIEFVWPSP